MYIFFIILKPNKLNDNHCYNFENSHFKLKVIMKSKKINAISIFGVVKGTTNYQISVP